MQERQEVTLTQFGHPPFSSDDEAAGILKVRVKTLPRQVPLRRRRRRARDVALIRLKNLTSQSLFSHTPREKPKGLLGESHFLLDSIPIVAICSRGCWVGRTEPNWK